MAATALKAREGTGDSSLALCGTLENISLSQDKDGTEVSDEDEFVVQAQTNKTYCLLPEDLLVHILIYLEEMGIVSFLFTCKDFGFDHSYDRVYKILCERTYAVQSNKPSVSFKGRGHKSWKYVYINRPRVRYNGIYYLRIAYCKKPERSMFTDVPVGAMLEVVYFRSLNFRADGTVRYCMDFHHPSKIISWFELESHPKVFIGSYVVKKNTLEVSVPLDHAIVEFHFRICSDIRGKHVILELEDHLSKSLKDPREPPCYFTTYNEHFRYMYTSKI